MDPAWIGIIVLGLSQLGALALTLRKLAGGAETRQILPEPFIVAPTACDKRHADVDRRIAAIETLVAERARESATQIAQIFDRLLADLESLRKIQIESSRGTHQRLNALVDVVAAQGRELSELKGRISP